MDSTTDVEQFKRVEQSIKLLAELIQNGAKVIPALTAPENVQNLFPDFSNLNEITSKIKQIEHKED